MTRILLSAVLAALVLAAPARATQVSYIDDGQVWVSTLDGAQKRSLSGPAPVVDPAKPRAWTEQVQSDDGWILGVHRVSGYTSTAITVLWDPSGRQAGNGTLTYPPARVAAAFPVYLDLTPDGKVVTYTYSDLVYNYPVSTLYEGTWIEGSSSWFVPPFDLANVTGSSLVGKRLVGISGSQIVVQQPVSGAPYSNASDFDPWISVSGVELWQVDVAANGSMIAMQFDDSGDVPRIGLNPISGLGQPLTAEQDQLGCLLPTVGKAGYPSISQDGETIAWHDDRGVLVAGRPVWFASAEVSTCVLSRPPVVISATGHHPSLGNSTAATSATTTPPPPPPPGGPGSTGPGPDTTKPPAKPAATVAKTVKAAAFAKGVPVTVSVAKAGTVTVTAKVGKTVLAKTSKKVSKAGKVKLTLKASKRVARKLRGYRGKTLTITIKAPGGTVTVKRKLR